MISVLQLGTVDYATGLRLQQRLVELRKAGQIGDVLLLLDHTPVITLGRNAKAANVIAPPEQLAQRGVEVFECDRGGDVTFHGPGQLVGYPIFDLRGYPSSDGKRKTLGAVEYVRRLEEVLIRTCAEFGVPTKRIPGLTGVWTDPPTLSSRAGSRACPELAEGDLAFPPASVAVGSHSVTYALTAHSLQFPQGSVR
jgi:lipoyl(octanoyl) transferase